MMSCEDGDDKGDDATAGDDGGDVGGCDDDGCGYDHGGVEELLTIGCWMEAHVYVQAQQDAVIA